MGCHNKFIPYVSQARTLCLKNTLCVPPLPWSVQTDIVLWSQADHQEFIVDSSDTSYTPCDSCTKCSEAAHLSNLASKTISTSRRTDGMYFKAATWIDVEIALILYVYLHIQHVQYRAHHWNRYTQNKQWSFCSFLRLTFYITFEY